MISFLGRLVLLGSVGALDPGSPICPCIDPFNMQNAQGEKIIPLDDDDGSVKLVKDGGKCLSKDGDKYPAFFTDASAEDACKDHIWNLRAKKTRGAHYFASGYNNDPVKKCAILVDYGVDPRGWNLTNWTQDYVSDENWTGNGTGMVGDATEDADGVKCFAYWRYAVLKDTNNIRVREDYGTSCDKPDYDSNVFPDAYFNNTQCNGSSSDASFCKDSFCWVDACTCGIEDASQTSYFVQLTPASNLTYSYRTCARCHSRTLDSCVTQTVCAVVNGRCVDKTETHSWIVSDCLSREEHCCGGKLNVACMWSNAAQQCIAAPPSDKYQFLGCPIDRTGRDDCKCLSGSANAHLAFGANSCRPWNHKDTLGFDATGNNCDGAHCKDTWCFVNGCSCGSGDAFEVDGIAVSRLTCAQCGVRATQPVCELHTSCEWDSVGFCKERDLDRTCSCNSTACNRNCALEWTPEVEKQRLCGKISVWPPTGAPLRSNIFFAQAASRGKLYFYGAKTSELWSFDLTNGRWKMITDEARPFAPQARQGASMIADQVTNTLYIFGGKSGQVFLNDIWAFNITTETWVLLAQKSPIAPPRRSRPASAFIIVNGVKQLLYYGGHDAGKAFDDWWLYDVATDKWANFMSSGQVAEARVDAKLIFLHGYSSNPIALLYGGTKYPFENFEFTSGFVVRLTPDDQSCNHFIRLHSLAITADSKFGSPVGRYLASGTPTTNGKHALIAGGWGSAADVTFGDVWKLKLDVYVDASNVHNFTAQWRCLLPPDPAWPPPNKTVMANEEYRWGWSGLQGSVVNDHLYLGSGWTELGNANSVRSVNIGALETKVCRDALTSIPLRPSQCRFALVKRSFTMKSPESHYGHGAAMQLDSMYIFGGTDGSRMFGELWRWDTAEWRLLAPIAWSETRSWPKARSHMVFLAVRDLLWMFGGLLDSVPTAEVWLYDPVAGRWVSNLDAPVALSHSCAQVDPDTNAVWIYGGRLSAGFVSDRLWKVDVLRDIWTGMGSWEQRYDCAMHILAGVLTTVLGADAYDNTYTDGFFVELGVSALTFRDVTWPLDAQGKKPPIHGSQLGSVQVGTSLYIVGGKPWNMFFTAHENFISRFTLNNGDVVAYSTNLCRHTDACCSSGRRLCWAPPEHKPQIVLSQTSVVHFQNNLVIFGGEEPNGMVSADILRIDIARSDGIHYCSPGTYGPACKLCSAGHYGAGGPAAPCKPCPPGTSNPNMGAASRSHCRQCQHGKKAGASGTADCVECNANETCLIGTIIAAKASTNATEKNSEVIAPEPFKRSDSVVRKRWKTTLYVTGIAFGCILLMVLIMTMRKGVKWTLAKIRFFDILHLKGHGLQRDGIPYPSICGIFIVMIMVLFFIVLVGKLFWTLVHDNIAETKTVVPAIVATDMLEDYNVARGENAQMTFWIEIVTSISGLTAPCVARPLDATTDLSGKWLPCASDISVVYASADMPCADALAPECDLAEGNVCHVRLLGNDCSLATSITHVDFVFDHAEAIATEITSRVTVSSSIPMVMQNKKADPREQEPAMVRRRILPTHGNVFKGAKIPTTMVVLCVPSLYTYGSPPDYDVVHTGLYLEIEKSNPGQQLHSTKLSYASGLSTRITMVRSQTTLVTSRVLDKDWEEMIGEAGGAIEIVMIGGVILLMYINVIKDRAVAALRRQSSENNKVVICHSTISSSSVRLRGQMFFIRCAIGTPIQFELETFDANLTVHSRNLVGRRKYSDPNMNLDDDGCVPLDPLTFDFRLSEQRLDVNLTTEFETFEDITLMFRVQIVECAKGRILAAAEVEVPKSSDGRVKKNTLLFPSKTAHTSIQSHNIAHSADVEPATNDGGLDDSTWLSTTSLFGYRIMPMLMGPNSSLKRSGSAVLSLGNLEIELERSVFFRNIDPGRMESSLASSLNPEAPEDMVNLPDDCEPFQNILEASVAYYHMEKKLARVERATNSSPASALTGRNLDPPSNDSDSYIVNDAFVAEKATGVKHAHILFEEVGSGFARDGELNSATPGIHRNQIGALPLRPTRDSEQCLSPISEKPRMSSDDYALEFARGGR